MRLTAARLLTALGSTLCLSCASQRALVVMEEPREGRALVVGAVLVENDGVEDVYEVRKGKIHVILLGRGTVDGKEESVVYRVMTDENGYFFVPNALPGAYVVKGIEVDLGYNTRLQVTSRWEGNTQVYYVSDGSIDYTVRVWPRASTRRIIDLGIRYFRIDASYRIYDNVFESLEDATISLPNVKHTMANPVAYFKTKYPEAGWWK